MDCRISLGVSLRNDDNRSTDGIDAIIKEKRGEGGGGADQKNVSPFAKAQKPLKGVVDKGCSSDPDNFALG